MGERTVIKLFQGKQCYNYKMSACQQNKQSEQQKRTTNLKFLSIKSILRNKKLIVKKSVPKSTFYPRSNNTYSTCQLGSQLQDLLREQRPSQRVFSNHKQLAVSGINTNIITIKFKEENENVLKQSDHKIRKKFTNNFNIYSDDIRKPSLNSKEKTELGGVEETLIIQPLQKLQNHFGWDKKKGFYNYMLITKKTKKNNRDLVLGQQTLGNFRQIAKITTQTQFLTKRRSQSKQQSRTTTTGFVTSETQMRPEKSQKTQKFQVLTEEKSATAIQNERIQKQRQKQLNQCLLKQYREILPIRKPNTKKDYFVFGMSEKPIEPQNKIEIFRDFLWKINYSNGLYVFTPQNFDSSYKAHIGFGNNSCMLKSILRRRSWWTIVQSNSQVQSCQFVWTQLKINSFFKGQPSRELPASKFNESQESIGKQELKSEFTNIEQVQNMAAHSKIFNSRDRANWEQHLKRNAKTQQKINQQTHVKRLRLLAKKEITKVMESSKIKIHNHLEFNFYLGNKKALFYNIKRLCQLRKQNPFDYIPLTFHVSKGTEDPVYEQFMTHYKRFEQLKKTDKNFRNIWICKPGQNTNRGNGISVCSGLDDIRHRLRGKQKNGDGKARTFILQKYIEKPFLYKNRKFDIRHYMLLTFINGNFKAYWFEQGYIRTSSSIFSLKNSNDLMVHLTNDAVQKKADTYGKHQKGNKISYEDFQKYLDSNYKRKYDFVGKTLQKMKKIALTAVEATYFLLDPNRRQHNFQLIGLDFMIDDNFRPWLIEANTNPCLELSSPLLEKLIPSVVEQTFRICVDPLFPPPENCSIKNKFYGENATFQNRFELIFDESVDGQKIRQLFKQQTGSGYADVIGKIEQDNQLFEDDGHQNWQQKNDKNTS